MSEVLIDGIEYRPVADAAPPSLSMGIGVTTRNRPEVLAHTLAEIRRFTPDAIIVVVDDGSSTPIKADTLPDNVVVHRFEENVGIARAKNRCLEMLYELGVEHIFLFDDDAYPILDSWWAPYVNSPEPHLMRIFLDLAGPAKLNDIKVISHDHELIAYTAPRGVMLYCERRVLRVVGGMDVAFGLWGYEHGDWSNRIHNAGLTTWRFADVVASDELIYAMDEHEEVERTVDRHARKAAVAANLPRYQAQYDSAEYREFRIPRDVILTSFFTTVTDPQRNGHKPPTVDDMLPLLASISGHNVVVFADSPIETTFQLEPVSHGVDNLYIQRWISYYRWLNLNQNVRYVWMVDGTDVELLGTPFPLLEDTLYIGSEETTTGSAWLRRNPQVDVEMSSGYHLLNPGLLGGDRKTVLEFLHQLITAYEDNQTQTFLGKAQDATITVNDMGLVNIVARRPQWKGRLVYGPAVNTPFKRNERNKWSTWRHK